MLSFTLISVSLNNKDALCNPDTSMLNRPPEIKQLQKIMTRSSVKITTSESARSFRNAARNKPAKFRLADVNMDAFSRKSNLIRRFALIKLYF